MILIVGGTGFVGRNLVRRLRQDGAAVRAVVRNAGKAGFLKELGAELVEGDISDRASLEKAAAGCDRVIHLVGIIQEAPGATFRQVHVEGTKKLVEASRKAGVRHFVYQSALGTRPGALSEYHKTKWEAEELVRRGGMPYTILRPSLIYGAGDQFTVRLAGIIKQAPMLPVLGSGRSLVQPIFVEDEAACIAKAATTDCCLNKTLEIGGPEQLTYEEVTRAIAAALGIRRPAVHVPLFFLKPAVRMLETALAKPPVTRDQLIMLQEDNICGLKDIRETFGIEPLAFREGLTKVFGEKR